MAERCSFCGQSRRDVDRLVVGHRGVAICADCARLAAEISSYEADSSGDLLLTGIGALVTNDRRWGGGFLGVIEAAAVAVRDGLVTWVGRQRSMPDRYRRLPEIDCGGAMVAPGLVDAHRHLTAPSVADLDAIGDLAVAQLGVLLDQGATTVELRTWGALGPEEEVTMLSGIRAAAESLPTDVVSTVVAGSTPPERGAGYRAMLETVILPTAAGIASYVDVVVGDALDPFEANSVIEAGRRHGMRSRVHVDRPEALELAIESGALSVDGMAGMEHAASAVAAAGAVMVSVPVESWAEGEPDPAAAMWEAGVVVALGTGCRRFSVPSMPLAMAVSVHHGRLSPEQALWSATRGGALAVEEPEKGVVFPGATADLILLDAETPSDLVTEPGRHPVVKVVKNGVVMGR